MNNDDTLISQLIAETCKEPDEKDSTENFVDLRNYFEKRLNQVSFNSVSEYLCQQQLSFRPLVFENNIGCYRVEMNEMVLDFPSNWSIFKNISNSDFLYLDQSNDQDFLIDIFSELSESADNIAIVKEENEIQLIFLSNENSIEHKDWFKEYFNKKNSLKQKLALAA